MLSKYRRPINSHQSVKTIRVHLTEDLRVTRVRKLYFRYNDLKESISGK